MKIDCHLHLPVREGLPSLEAQKSLLLKELRANDIDYGIVISDNVQESSIGNLDQCLGLFGEDDPVFVMPAINILTQPTSDPKRLDNLFDDGRIVGLKIFPGHDEHYPDDRRLEPFIDVCLRHNAPFAIHTGWNSGRPDAAKWNDPKYIVKLASTYPNLKVVICHYFWPEVEYCYRITRTARNIFFDVSGLADKEVEDATGRQTVKSVLERTALDNPRSLMLGSDYGGADMGAHVALIDSLRIPEQTRQAIFARNAIELYRLSIETRFKEVLGNGRQTKMSSQ